MTGSVPGAGPVHIHNDDATPHVTGPTDEQLFEAYRDGDVGALRMLIERYHDDLLSFLIRLTGNRQTAEDVFQDTFLQIHLAQASFDATRRFKPWLFTIAANKARDTMRKRGRRHEVDLSAPVAGGTGEEAGGGGQAFVDLMEVDIPAPGDPLLERERDDLVQRAVDRLPESLKEILLLAYFQRLSYNQIAEELGIPLGTVKSRLHAAVAAFARSWKVVWKERKG